MLPGTGQYIINEQDVNKGNSVACVNEPTIGQKRIAATSA